MTHLTSKSPKSRADLTNLRVKLHSDHCLCGMSLGIKIYCVSLYFILNLGDIWSAQCMMYDNHQHIWSKAGIVDKWVIPEQQSKCSPRVQTRLLWNTPKEFIGKTV